MPRARGRYLAGMHSPCSCGDAFLFPFSDGSRAPGSSTCWRARKLGKGALLARVSSVWHGMWKVRWAGGYDSVFGCKRSWQRVLSPAPACSWPLQGTPPWQRPLPSELDGQLRHFTQPSKGATRFPMHAAYEGHMADKPVQTCARSRATRSAPRARHSSRDSCSSASLCQCTCSQDRPGDLCSMSCGVIHLWRSHQEGKGGGALESSQAG